MKQNILIISILLLTSTCTTVKKVQNIQEAISKKDTSATVVIKAAPKVDSAAIVTEIMSRVLKSKIEYKTFNAKIKVGYEGPETKDNYTAYVSMRKDSVMVIKVSGTFLGISKLGLQVRITRDSVVLVKMVEDKSVLYRSISYLQDVTQIPFDFATLQDLIIGNPIFIGNIVSYRSNASQLLVLMLGETFKHLLTVDASGDRILYSKLDDVDVQRNRTGDITFSDYQNLGAYQFATKRRISVAEKSKLDISMDFKEYDINQPMKYTFEIPKNFKKK